MKSWIFKGLGYLATAGAAATTVLLTASSVGLKKSLSETFPQLDGLIQDRPDVLEEPLKPEEPPQQPATPPPPPPGGASGQHPTSTPSSTDDQSQNQDNSSQQAQPSGGGASSSTQGGVPSSSGGGVSCDPTDPKTTLINLQSAVGGLLDAPLISVHERTSGIGDCLQQFETKLQPSSAPTTPVA